MPLTDTDDEREYAGDDYETHHYEEDKEEASREYVDEYGDDYGDDGDAGEWGLATVLLVVGVILFIIPEPITSTLGILLIIAGVVAWLVSWF